MAEPQHRFDVTIYAEVTVCDVSDIDEARALIKTHLRLHPVYLLPGAIYVDQEGICDDAIKLVVEDAP